MNHQAIEEIQKSQRIDQLKEDMFRGIPEIESARAVLLTESYMQTEGLPMIKRRSAAFRHILEKLPIIIRYNELIVGSPTLKSRGCQVYPEYSYEWLEQELDTMETRAADPFHVSEQTKKELRAIFPYWKGKTSSELANSYMSEEAKLAIEHNIFTPGNYYYNGVGHVTVNYGEVLEIGYEGIRAKAEAALKKLNQFDADYCARCAFLESVIESCNAVITYANRYAELAKKEAESCADAKRKEELLTIAKNCERVPAKGATSFYEACQSFWFVQMLIQVESSGHSISPGRFDQYMYPYFKKDFDNGKITLEFAQELVDCVWLKLNDFCKARDVASAEGFAGYGLFQNLIAGGQTKDGQDATNELSYMSIQATMHVFLPQPSFSVRVWNGSPQSFLLKAAELTRTGIGFPAYYNDEVIIPALINRGLTIQDARDYNIIGCVEPQKSGKTDGWHDAAFFNMCRPMELVFSGGKDGGKQISVDTGDVTKMTTFDEFYDAYKAHMNYMIELMVNADNAIDMAHAERCPLPYLSSMIEDCIGKGKSVQEGGAVYNFTGPQGFGIANMADALYAIKKLVFEEKSVTLAEYKQALEQNFGQGNAEEITTAVVKQLAAQGVEITEEDIASIYKQASAGVQKGGSSLLKKIEALPKFGNDIDEIDQLARDVAYTYTRPLEQYKNPRGGQYQAGLYPVSANVPLGAQTGATPDGRLAFTPIADGVSPAAGRDVKGPTAAANSVSKLDHSIASNGTLYNMKFHPSALKGLEGLENFVALIRAFFDQKGSHVQFNVVSRETLYDAQQHPENYKNLVVRVAGYSALFTSLSRSLQDDIINRTEQSAF
ncbi:MAG: glycyl radical protein [Ruminococcaceae bacterium]|nr:glycyl radical protein [Oscillospiraceae bacterium]